MRGGEYSVSFTNASSSVAEKLLAGTTKPLKIGCSFSRTWIFLMSSLPSSLVCAARNLFGGLGEVLSEVNLFRQPRAPP